MSRLLFSEFEVEEGKRDLVGPEAPRVPTNPGAVISEQTFIVRSGGGIKIGELIYGA